MRVWRKDNARLVIIEGLGSYPLDTLEVGFAGERISLYDTVRGRYLFRALPYTKFDGANGPFSSAGEAAAYLVERVSSQLLEEVRAYKDYPAASIEATLRQLIDTKLEQLEWEVSEW